MDFENDSLIASPSMSSKIVFGWGRSWTNFS